MIDPAISESVFSSVEPESRDHYTRPTEFLLDSDPRPRLENWAGTAHEQRSWWAEQLIDLDEIFDYLQHRELGKFTNFDTGYILALLHGRPSTAAHFARLPLTCNRSYWAVEKKYALLVDAQRAFADAIGVKPPPMPTSSSSTPLFSP